MKRFICLECGKDFDKAIDSINCCVEKRIPFQVGDIITYDKAVHYSPNAEGEHWLFYSEKSETVSNYSSHYSSNNSKYNYNMNYYFLYVITAITENETTITSWINNKSVTKPNKKIYYHLKSKALDTAFGHGRVDEDDMEEKATRVHDVSDEIYKEAEEFIGSVYTCGL
ncbi:MAG: hypothetical protein ACOCV1_02505 [Bacillota bacterium]